jgi:hypothetical protein
MFAHVMIEVTHQTPWPSKALVAVVASEASVSYHVPLCGEFAEG